jgi:hypothetical protein
MHFLESLVDCRVGQEPVQGRPVIYEGEVGCKQGEGSERPQVMEGWEYEGSQGIIMLLLYQVFQEIKLLTIEGQVVLVPLIGWIFTVFKCLERVACLQKFLCHLILPI